MMSMVRLRVPQISYLNRAADDSNVHVCISSLRKRNSKYAEYKIITSLLVVQESVINFRKRCTNNNDILCKVRASSKLASDEGTKLAGFGGLAAFLKHEDRCNIMDIKSRGKVFTR